MTKKKAHSLVTVNDVQRADLRKRMLIWFDAAKSRQSTGKRHE